MLQMAIGKKGHVWQLKLLAAGWLLTGLCASGAVLEKLRGSGAAQDEGGLAARWLQTLEPETAATTGVIAEAAIKKEEEKGQQSAWTNAAAQEGEDSLLIVGDMFQALSPEDSIKDSIKDSMKDSIKDSIKDQQEQSLQQSVANKLLPAEQQAEPIPGVSDEQSAEAAEKRQEAATTRRQSDEATTEEESSSESGEKPRPQSAEEIITQADSPSSQISSDDSTAAEQPVVSGEFLDVAAADIAKLEEDFGDLVAELGDTTGLGGETSPARAQEDTAPAHGGTRRALQELPYYMQLNPLSAMGRSKYRLYNQQSHSHETEDDGHDSFINFRQHSISRDHSSEEEDLNPERAGEGTVVEEMGKAIVSMFLGTQIPSNSDSSDDSDSDDNDKPRLVPQSQVHHHYYSSNSPSSTAEPTTTSSTPAPPKAASHVLNHTSSSPERNCFECDVDYFGYDVEKIENGVPDLQACQRRCQRHPMCDFFTYSEQWHGCYLKHSRREKFVEKEKILISGLKYCNNSGSITCHGRTVHWALS